jgi:hypothetical protein
LLLMEVVVLNSAVNAWNVDGSSDDTLEDSTWIRYWEKETGQTRGVCSFAGCKRLATVGGHVWIQRRGVHLTPICSGCNYWENASRMQDAEGNHSQLRVGLHVIPRKMTAGMKQTQRRIATSWRQCP